MENAADALKMAAWVLIFVVALSFSMNAFTLIKGNIDTIVEDTDRQYLTKYVEGNKDSSGKAVTERIVGAEAIVPTIYRAFKDTRLRVEFANITLFQKWDKTSNSWKDVNYIDSSELNLTNDNVRQAFMQMLMYGKLNYLQVNDFRYDSDYFEKNKKIKFNNNFKLYDLYLKYANVNPSIKFKETTGVYYIQDVEDSNGKSQSDIPESQKTKKRIIKYTQN